MKQGQKCDPEDVGRLRREHPEWTLQRIADTVGVSRQRVHQILRRQAAERRSLIAKAGSWLRRIIQK